MLADNIDVDNSLKSYCDIVSKANDKLNLVSRRDVNKIIHQLVEESLYVFDWDVCKVRTPLLDIGSGGGIPGIPIKLAKPDICLILLDARRKKSLFLRNCAMMLKLTDTDAVHGRAEEINQNPIYVGHFNTVVSRGVTTLNNLLKWSHPLLKPEGELIVWKGSSVVDELERLENDGWSDPDVKRYPTGLTLVRFEKR